MQQTSVYLGDVLAGYVRVDDRGRPRFRLAPSYRRLPDRPVLGQAFEDDLDKTYTGKRTRLPPFFANLIPEGGPLRRLLERSHDVPEGDDLALLAAVGDDLPGAVRITETPEIPADVEGLFEPPQRPDGARDGNASGADIDPGRLRFSLAGVQMKFSVLTEGERITLPSRNELGQWIVKLDSTRFPHLVENEFATMAWAREAGFEVPDCRLFPREALPEALRQRAPEGSQVFAIRRYDRDGARRIHQEDFAQVVGLYPEQKYEHVRYEQLALLARAIEGREEAYDEVVRRLVLMVATGNYDAHLKNWSLVYPDGIRAQLAPLYDQVAVAAWPGEVERTWALKLAGVKDPFQTDTRAFERLASRAEADSEHTLHIVSETLERLTKAWPASHASAVMPADHVEHLRAYWRRVPLLRPLAAALG